jgi:hypothetical protein
MMLKPIGLEVVVIGSYQRIAIVPIICNPVSVSLRLFWIRGIIRKIKG